MGERLEMVRLKLPFPEKVGGWEMFTDGCECDNRDSLSLPLQRVVSLPNCDY